MTPPAPQRKRVAQACDRCRSRKDKCDGAKPVCSTCVARGHSCSYDPTVKKRGLPEGYVRGLENLWGFAIREAPEIETTVLSLLGQRHITESVPRGWNSQDSGETLLDTWRKSRLSRELDALLALLEISDDRLGKRKRQDKSLTPPTEASTSDPTSIVSPNAYLVRAGQHNTSSTFPVPGINGTASSQTMRPTGAEQFQLPDNTWELLDVYFSYTHCWLPIVEKHNPLRASYQYPTVVSVSTSGSGDHAALWAILAYAECHHVIIKKGMTQAVSPQVENPWVASDTYKTARSLIPDEEGVYELGHVQCLLILTLLNMGQNRWKQAWFLIGQAVRIAIELGLENHLDEAKSRNRHVFFGCFVLETLLAARLNRRPHLRANDAMKCGLLLEDGSDEWSPWVDCLGIRRDTGNSSRGPGMALSTFNRLVQISALLNAIICGYSIGTEDHGKFDLLLQKFGWDSKVQDKSSLPLPHQYHLDCLYAATRAPLNAGQRELASPAKECLPELLDSVRSHYGLLAIPPTFDCIAHIFIRHYASHGTAVASEKALNSFVEILTEMAQTWPTFQDTLLELHKLRSSLSGPGLPTTRHKYLQTPNSNIMDNADSSFGESDLRRRTPLEDPVATPNSSEYTPSGQAILEAAIQFDPSLLSTTDEITQINTTWTLPISGTKSATNLPKETQPSRSGASQPYNSIRGSQKDDDSPFNESAILDAMKWTSNWDQSRQNLGSTDLDNLKEDFQAFFQEPNFHSSDQHGVAQHHMPSSVAPTGQDDLMEYSNPHVEASQILQALSASDITAPQG